MKPTFEQMKGAAIDVRRKFFRGCSGAFYNIIECNYDPLYLTATLGKTCRERRTEEQRDFPF